jgi:hypothetical protein
MTRLVDWLMAHRVIGALFLVVATAAGAWFARGVGVDNAVDVWFVEDDPALERYRAFQKTFGNDETIVVGVEIPEGVWSPGGLALVRGLSERIAALDGIRRVLSVVTVNTITPRGAALDVRPLLPASGPDGSGAAVPAEAAVAEARARFAADPLLQRGLVTDDGRMTAIVAQMRAMDDIDRKRDEVIGGVEEVLGAALGPAGERWWMSGVGVVYNALNRISQAEGALFVGLSQLLIFLILLVFFRRLGPVVLSLLAVGLATVWLMGVFTAAGRAVNMVTMVLPTLVLVIGVTDAIHIHRHAADLAPDADRRALARSIGFIAVPCLFNSITVIAGFASLATSKMAVVRDLGVFASIGIAFAFVATMAVTTVALPARRVRPRPAAQDRLVAGLAERIVRLTALVQRRRETVVGLTLVVTLGGAYGVSLLEVDTFSLGFLPDDHPTVQATRTLEARLGPFTPLEFTVATGESEGLKDPTLLRGVRAWQRALEQREDVRSTLSLADVAARVHQVLAGGPDEVPADADQLWQGLELYEQDSDNDRVHLADPTYRVGRMTAAVPMLSSVGFAALIDDGLRLAREHVPPSAQVEAAGYLPLYVTMMDYIVDSQVSSFATAFLVVFGLIGLLFRSVRMATLSIVPNVFPLFVLLGLMGVTGVRLDVATVTITAIVLGVAVDDTIQYLFRYRAELRANGGDHDAAALATARATGPAIVATTAVLCAGFLVLAAASVKSIAYFGLLSSFALAVALVGDLLVLPAILGLVRPKL